MNPLAAWRSAALILPAAAGILSPTGMLRGENSIDPTGPLTSCLSIVGQDALAFEDCLAEQQDALQAAYGLPQGWLAEIHSYLEDNPAWRGEFATLADRLEDHFDRRESVRDRDENRLDHRENVRDRREDRWDRLADRNDEVLDMEDLFDRREDRRDSKEDRTDQRENQLDRFENRWDRRENRWDRQNP